MIRNNFYRRCRKAVAFGFKNRTKIDKSLCITKKYGNHIAWFPSYLPQRPITKEAFPTGMKSGYSDKVKKPNINQRKEADNG